ncbi:MAG: DUF1735 domain-containing protein [Bacteroidota bacterium]
MKLYRTILAAGVLSVAFSGCLKDESTVLNPDNVPSVIEFQNTANISTGAATNPITLSTIKIQMDPTTQTYNAVVSYSGAKDAPDDITVTVGLSDPAVLALYNSKQATTYTVLPSTNYSFPSTTVTIKKGTRKVNFPIALTGTDQLFGKNYVLPLTIKSVSSGTISGNFQHMLYLITGVCKLDGVYELHYKFDYIPPAVSDRGYDLFATPWYYSDIQMLTQSTTTSALVNLNAGTTATAGVHAATAAGLPTNIPTTVPLLTFDPVTYKVTSIKNNVTTSTRTLSINSAYDNRMDKTTGNIYVSFKVDETGKSQLLVTDTLLYKTPRP